ncbi:YafY family transcriptional regulator [Bacillus safensis]|uniref:helix-turn-helix transcriptional regulator n=1 Tax=Bacillus TaxID=1386 RepID=UPI00203A9397|nr:YafY family protein [Bacillus safensis]MCM2984851.1 YafY family transcriptional regulator [Bacillus safensis]MCY7447566.1 YafY family transcriptional regulator [Bacillus safensis]MCY7457569.1 YafY family transcriptional regulator [Bacillus safensis]MDP4564816.1 YafY family protein [Bacillus safensis]MEC0922191.1 YafY family protein [Bacillus safensis]
MKIDRILSIVMLLISKKQVQAKDLAELHEVSVRTIYRDIDTINQAGIPVVTTQGAGGGISLVDDYRLEKKLFTDDDIELILTALESMTSAYSFKESEHVLKKIKSLIPPKSDESEKQHHVFIDLSSWGKDSQAEKKLQLIHTAASAHQFIQFTYRNAKGETLPRKVEPYTLVLKGRHWYLYAFCCVKNDFRLFKLTRMTDLITISVYFRPKRIKNEEKPWNDSWHEEPSVTTLTLRLTEASVGKVKEWVDENELIICSDGTYLATLTVSQDDWLHSFLFHLGPDADILSPQHIKEAFDLQLKQFMKRLGT